MSIQDYFTQKATRIRHSTSGPSDTGSWSRTEATEDISGRLAPGLGTRAQLELSAQQRVSEGLYTWYCAAGTDIEAQDVLVIDDTRYQVLRVADPVSMGHHLECALELIPHSRDLVEDDEEEGS